VISVTILYTDRVGYVVYQFEYQIVAAHFTDETY
jgi:hypothetical protein